MKKGFTLAEILITLAIIGVVAAITIPVVVHKYQQKMFYTQFMKSYNTMQTAFAMIKAEHGDITSWGIPYYGGEAEESADSNEYVYNLFAKYLNIQEEFGLTIPPGVSDYYVPGSRVNKINGDRWNNYGYFFGGTNSGKSAILQDGSIISISGSAYTAADAGTEQDDIQIFYAFDTNGTKGPNTIGRDIFEFKATNFVGNAYRKFGGVWAYSENRPCDPSFHGSNDAGLSCAERLLQEGKMNY